MQKFNDEMKKLVSQTTEMGSLVSSMISDSIIALDEDDTILAEKIIKIYSRVSEFDSSIENEALKIMQLFQPAASDVRTVATVLKIITYLERIGKYSANISKAALYLHDKQQVHQMDVLPAMGDVAVEMVNTAISSFANKDISILSQLSVMDTKLDSLRKDVVRNNISYMREDPNNVDVCTFYISVSRYLERVGDHACKIGEKVTYMVTGEHVEIE